MSPPREVRKVLLLLAAALVTLTGCSTPAPADPPAPAPSAPPAYAGTTAGVTVELVAVGDIACEPGEATTPTTCQQQATADLTTRLDPDRVLALGDLQYENGTVASFAASWAKSWGRFSDRLLAVPGNHEYNTTGAAGYRDYLGAPTHAVVELGTWRVYLMDSNCEQDACAAQIDWLTADLAAHPATCTAVAMHHPRWSSGAHGPQLFLQPLWEILVDSGVDLDLAAHDHDYERFDRLDVTGHTVTGTAAGTRQFVVGTGGKSFYEVREQRTGSQFLQNDRFGVLDLILRDEGYDWSYVDTDGEVLDRGTDTCST
ncbi:metallophosphoesterase [Nocardioides sp. P86]|uniref:metallophosphoesterase family protein n=1 Tax=Nocardioides sp. P86 TaxID=2939569 RepID=UPI00204033F4|nr:metallophosphoesterase [Nocardioides sp. P86]MCM3515156.1 metallophosphoesterase [Nocardioides sp. P86]